MESRAGENENKEKKARLARVVRAAGQEGRIEIMINKMIDKINNSGLKTD